MCVCVSAHIWAKWPLTSVIYAHFEEGVSGRGNAERKGRVEAVRERGMEGGKGKGKACAPNQLAGPGQAKPAMSCVVAINLS